MKASSAGRWQGFTLLEVMIALAIFASIAVVVSGTTSQSTDTLLTLENKSLASWVAENRLTELRLNHSLPSVGQSKDEVEMANREWKLTTRVEATDFPNVVRVTVSVAEVANADSTIATLTTVMGAYD
ncbi:type II secretion system minor pseudopilin GspI [Oceanobacter mangrovi]|uniref:type II secretion system minor pseudopilin GspI n=1 Tax=Oceanobacter mangrovi TaxID=2862510 RepID=UPI001C8D7CC5|nr:type II secretion system minor pseudopilin GspI [Oceanobacter mangrovi]